MRAVCVARSLLATLSGLLVSQALAAIDDAALLAIGAALYERGEIAATSTVAIGEPPVEADAELFACANCHGADGRGRTEGGIAAPRIRWSHLDKPYPVLGNRFRLHPAYDEDAFARALRDGIDSAGQALAVAMPRYRLDRHELAGLIAHLRALDDDATTVPRLAIGVRLPTAVHPAAHQRNHIMRALLDAYAADIDARGGIYQRRIEWHYLAPGQAFGEPLLAGLDLALSGAEPLPADRTPVIALFANPAADARSSLEAVPRFALYSGVDDRAEVLRHHARQTFGVEPWQLDGTGGASTSAPSAVLYDGENVQELASRLSSLPAGTVLLLTRWLESPALIDLASRQSGPVHVAVPPTVELIGRPGTQLLARLGSRQPLPREQRMVQLWTLAVARTLVAVLEQSGHDVHRRGLTEALETWYRRDVGIGPPLTFSASRRTGAPGAVVLQLHAGSVERWRWLELDPVAEDPK